MYSAKKAVERTKNLSLISQVLSYPVHHNKQIDERAKTRDQLIEITKHLRTLYRDVKDDIDNLKKGHQIYYTSARKMEYMARSARLQLAQSYELTKLKESISILREEVKVVENETESAKMQIVKEKRLMIELNEAMKKMKAETLEKKKESQKLRKEIIISENQLEQLKQKCTKYITSLEKYYEATECSSP